MCLIALAWQADPRYSLVVAANRDEWRERPTEAAHWWEDHPQILAGRDLQAGGTWMGITKGGRFAAVTNFRDPSDKRSTALSRGTLVADFLLADGTPEAFLAGPRARAPRSSTASTSSSATHARLFYFGSREPTPRAIAPGVHGLSNHLLDEPWPKVVRAREGDAGRARRTPIPRRALFDMLSDTRGADDSELPDTGVGIEWERRLSPPLITGADYGSRASTCVAVGIDGQVAFEERSRGAAGEVEGVRKFDFRVS